MIHNQNKYKFKEVNKITIKFQEKISDVNICYFLKLPLPTSAIERMCYKKIVNSEEYINTYCYSNHTKFADKCTRWFL